MHSFGHKRRIYHVNQFVVRFATVRSAMSLVLSRNETTSNPSALMAIQVFEVRNQCGQRELFFKIELTSTLSIPASTHR